MITKEFLQQCSDEQINRGVVWAKISKFKLIEVCNAQSEIEFNASQNLVKDLGCGLFNPCEYPSDIMPIAFANHIALIPLTDNDNEIGTSSFNGDWKAISNNSTDGEFCYDSDFCECICANPLRAIAEVYILMSVNK